MTRRTFVAGGAAVAAPAVIRSQGAAAPPNVLLILCDQMRGDALGYLGNPNACTPNLDRLASEGVVFENAFSNNPVCVPSRKSIFSSHYPHQHGSLTNHGHAMLAPGGSLIDHFRKRGYRTGYVGKNHTFGNKELAAAVETASIRDREPFRAYNKWVTPWWYSSTYWPEEKCHPHLNTEDALRFLDASKPGQPFLLTVSYFDPHPPYFAPAGTLIRRQASAVRPPAYVPPAQVSPRLDEHARAMGFDKIGDADLRETMRHYHASVEWGVDRQVGRLLEALARNRLDERTIVVFTSDHGDFMGTHRMVRKGMFLHDALLNVPLIWRAPGRAAKGLRQTSQAQLIDIFPTLVDLTGGQAQDGLMGRSIKAALGGEKDDAREIVTSAGYGEMDFAELAKASETPLHTRVLEMSMTPRYKTKMLRSREWKLVLSESRPPELFHLNGGRMETRNVAGSAEFAALRAGLEKRLEKFWQW